MRLTKHHRYKYDLCQEIWRRLVKRELSSIELGAGLPPFTNCLEEVFPETARLPVYPVLGNFLAGSRRRGCPMELGETI
jgi:hypothetical protein